MTLKAVPDDTFILLYTGHKKLRNLFSKLEPTLLSETCEALTKLRTNFDLQPKALELNSIYHVTTRDGNTRIHVHMEPGRDKWSAIS